MGDGARAADLNPHPESGKHPDSSYIDTFEKFAVGEKLSADFLIVPGDVTNRAAPEEFILASKQIAKIANILRVDEDKVLFVPGNHDVDWAVMGLNPDDTSGYRKSQRYGPLVQPSCIFDAIFRRASVNTITDDDGFCIWHYDDVIAVGLNTAVHDGPATDVHHGLCGSDAIRKLKLQLDSLSKTSDKLRIAIFHHHPIQYSDPVPDEPDFSAMTNAESLLKLLEEYQFDLAIHGHKHKPNFNTHMISSYYQIPILGAGSFSYKLDVRWSGLVNNQFHVLETHDRCSDSSRIRGVLKSYTYLCGHGWRQSQDTNGIEHEVYFGGFLSEAALEKKLEMVIAAKLAPMGYLRLSDLLDASSEFRYVPQKLLGKVLHRLAPKLGFAVHGSAPRNTLLLKE